MMSAPSSTYENKDEQVDKCLVHKPRWLDAFLGEAFPRSCAAHRFRKKELIKYCINCNLSSCRHCVSSVSHRNHEVLNIYTHNHKVVVSLSDMEKHIDCSEIQSYNKHKRRVVISLNPQRKWGPASDVEASCNTCRRKLTDRKFRYCSISCKVNTVLRNTDEDPASIPTENPPQESQVEERQVETSEPPKPAEEIQEKPANPLSFRKRPRKGIPHRAPFF